MVTPSRDRNVRSLFPLNESLANKKLSLKSFKNSIFIYFVITPIMVRFHRCSLLLVAFLLMLDHTAADKLHYFFYLKTQSDNLCVDVIKQRNHFQIGTMM